MDEKQLQVLANELAKNLKTPEDLSQFDRLLKKLSVEAAFNADMRHHPGYEKNQSRPGANSRNFRNLGGRKWMKLSGEQRSKLF